MAIKPRYLQGRPIRRNILLDDCRLAPLEYVAPGNLSEAVRYCIQYALERGALDAAQLKHTPAQRAAVAKMRAAASSISAPTPNPAPVVTAPPAPAAAPYIAPATTLTAPNLSPELAAAFAAWDDTPEPAPAPAPAPYIAPAPQPAVDAWDKPADQLTEADQRAIMQRIEREMTANR